MPNKDIAVDQFPYWRSMIKSPKNSIIGGASIWALKGHPKKDYRGVAKFFSYLSRPQVQTDWHQFSGYLPITKDAYQLTKSQQFYLKHLGTE